jgi:hypothetical protein
MSAHAADPAIRVVAPSVVVDLVAIADVQPILGAIPPDRVLHEPREDFWKPPVELAGVNPLGDGAFESGRCDIFAKPFS